MIEVALTQRLGAFALDVAFTAGAGITALFGPSGAGKSATIAAIAGLSRPDHARISLDGAALLDTEKRVFVPKHRRRIGLVFQDSHLFPHLSVRHNLLFGRWFSPRGARGIALAPVIAALGIGHLLGRRPATLSGGERQRVAIGRALLSSPRLLLLDEPLAALDRERRLEILPLIERVRDEFGVPMIYVSHAMEEVARLAADVLMIENGRIVDQGTPSAVFGPQAASAGEDRFASASVLNATVAGEDIAYGLTELGHPAGRIWLAERGGAPGRAVRVVVHATDVTLALARPQQMSVRTALSGTIATITAGDGPLASIAITLDGGDRLAALATRKAVAELGLKEGDAVFALIKTVALDERMIG
jgi:molybdate transport system ATP-binding protein